MRGKNVFLRRGCANMERSAEPHSEGIPCIKWWLMIHMDFSFNLHVSTILVLPFMETSKTRFYKLPAARGNPLGLENLIFFNEWFLLFELELLILFENLICFWRLDILKSKFFENWILSNFNWILSTFL